MRELLRNWNLARSLRLLIALGFGYQAIATKQYLLLLFAGIFLAQAIFNISLCSVAGCAPTNEKGSVREVYKGQIQKYGK